MASALSSCMKPDGLETRLVSNPCKTVCNRLRFEVVCVRMNCSSSLPRSALLGCDDGNDGLARMEAGAGGAGELGKELVWVVGWLFGEYR